MAAESSSMHMAELNIETAHNAVIQKANKMVSLLFDDLFLSDFSEDCTVENVKSRLALLQGRAICVHINKFDGEVICECVHVLITLPSGYCWYSTAVIVLQGASVYDLMQAFQRKVEEQCNREGKTEHLSW